MMQSDQTDSRRVPPDWVPPNGPALERDAEPGELCSCGRQAVIVYFTERFGEVPWCGEYNDQDPG